MANAAPTCSARICSTLSATAQTAAETSRTDAPLPATVAFVETWPDGLINCELTTARRRPTVILGQQGKLVPSRGRYWIEPASGRVLMSELIAENEEVRGKIDVSYQSEPLVGLLVPIEMRGFYDGRHTGATIEERATYRNFRQFQVTVDEKLGPIEDKLKK
jgi:hypothetical protein